MPDFQRVQHAVFSPTRCATCMSSSCLGGFVDLLIETYVGGFQEDGDPVNTGQPLLGHLYLCVDCVRQAGRRADMIERSDYDTLVAEAQRQDGEIAGLRAELAIANDPASKVVDLKTAVQLAGELAQVIDLDAERKKRRPAQTSTKHRAG